MKATTLIFIVFVALGLWYLFNYMNKKSKLNVVQQSLQNGSGVLIVETPLSTGPVIVPVSAVPEQIAPETIVPNPVPVINTMPAVNKFVL